jgi:diguanylate cyclase (GGDEF)-like protein
MDAGHGYVGRYGGEEFVVVWLASTEDEAVGRSEAMRQAIDAEPFSDGEIVLPVTVSIGLATGQPGNARFDALLKHADAALYEAKRAGRNRTVVYRDNVNSTVD